MIETGVGGTGTQREVREDQNEAPEAPGTGKKHRVTEKEMMWSRQTSDQKVRIMQYIHTFAKCLLL